MTYLCFSGRIKGRRQEEEDKEKEDEDEVLKITSPSAKIPKLLLWSIVRMLLTCEHGKIRLNFKITFIALFSSISFVLLWGRVSISILKRVILGSSIGYITFLCPTNQ